MSEPTELSEGEEFREHPELPGYMVTSHGRVWSKFRSRYLCPFSDSRTGKQVLTLSRGDGGYVRRQVHRLVYEAFTGKPLYGGIFLRHIDGDRFNNHFSNIALHGSGSRTGKYPSATISKIRELSDGGDSKRSISIELEIPYSTVVAITSNRIYRDPEYTPRITRRTRRTPESESEPTVAPAPAPAPSVTEPTEGVDREGVRKTYGDLGDIMAVAEIYDLEITEVEEIVSDMIGLSNLF